MGRFAPSGVYQASTQTSPHVAFHQVSFGIRPVLVGVKQAGLIDRTDILDIVVVRPFHIFFQIPLDRGRPVPA